MTAPYGLFGEQPSAIQSLLAAMAPQQTPSAPPQIAPPPPQAAPLPASNLSPATVSSIEGLLGGQSKPHMLHRIAGLLSDLGHGISDRVVGNAPAGYDALLSPDEIKSARPSFLQSIIGTPDAPSPQERYRNNLNNIIGVKQVADQLATQQQAAAEHQRLLATRAAIGKQFQVPPNATPQQQVQTLMQMYTAYTQAGDTEMAGKMAEVLKSMGDVLQGPKPIAAKPPIELRLGDKVKLLDPDTRKEIGEYAVGATPRAPNVAAADPLVKVEVDDGQGGRKTIYVPRSQAAGMEPPSPAGGSRTTAAIIKAVANNQQQVATIDDALRELDKYPNAVGLKRGVPILGDALNQRVDPKGVAARASIANIGSLIIHDRSGAAVTVHEMPRLAPFVPNVNDTPDAIRTKLKKLREAIGVETAALQKEPRASGPATPSTGKYSPNNPFAKQP